MPLFDLVGGLNNPPRAALSITKVASKLDKDAIREKLIWGPFKVKAANVG
jgi:hypothetical protein